MTTSTKHLHAIVFAPIRVCCSSCTTGTLLGGVSIVPQALAHKRSMGLGSMHVQRNHMALLTKRKAVTGQLHPVLQGKFAPAKNGASILSPRLIQAVVKTRAGSTALTYQSSDLCIALPCQGLIPLRIKQHGCGDFSPRYCPSVTSVRRIRRDAPACASLCKQETGFRWVKHTLRSRRRTSSGMLRRGRPVSRPRSYHARSLKRPQINLLVQNEDDSRHQKAPLSNQTSTNTAVAGLDPEPQRDFSQTQEESSVLETGSLADAADVSAARKRKGPENVVIEAVVGGATELLRLLGVGGR
jgi:hypothetical protein